MIVSAPKTQGISCPTGRDFITARTFSLASSSGISSCASRLETVSSMLIGMWYEKMDSVYNQLYQELVSTYPNSHSYTDGTTYFIVKKQEEQRYWIGVVEKG